MKTLRPGLVAFSLLLASAAFAADSVPVSSAPVIGRIMVIRHDVFDGDDLHFPYSLANAIHVDTQDAYIRRELLFREGDLYDPAAIDESERLLRSRPIFREVHVSTAAAGDGRVDVTVETADVWTTTIRPSYGIAGGQKYYGMGVLESNFLGQGRELGAFVFHDIDRTTRGVSYYDPHVVGSRWTLNSGYGKDEKGREYEVDLDRPFYSSRVRDGGGLALRVLDDEDRLYADRQESTLFQHATKDGRAYFSHALEADPDRVRRITAAYERREDRFSDVRVEQPPEFPLPSPLDNRVVSAALLGFDYRNLSYRKFDHLYTFDRVEDENLGVEWLAEAGPSLRSMGATRDGALGRFQVQKVLGWGDRLVWINHADADGRLEANTLHNGILRLRSEAFLVDWREDNTASLRAAWTGSHNLDPETQYRLGGDTGLRAYPIREVTGANTAFATLENRKAIAYDWLKLVSVGWAVFADAGSAWERGGGFAMDQVKTDVGAGLRLAPSRSTDPSLIHIDLAYALQNNESSSRLALNIGADIHFGQREIRKFEQ